MQYAVDVQFYLQSKHIAYSETTDFQSVEIARRLRVVFLHDSRGAIAVFVPYGFYFDNTALNELTSRTLRSTRWERNSDDTIDAAIVLRSAILDAPVFVFDAIPDHGALYIASDDNQKLALRVDARELTATLRPARRINCAFELSAANISARHSEQRFVQRRLSELLDDVDGLPAMPQMAQRIVQVTRDKNADATMLAKVIEVDPSLSAQIVSYATSAYYGYRGEIASVRDAIARVLGFELVANVALGIAIGTTLKVQDDGPLGLNAFWKHAVYTSALAERLCKAVARDRQLRPATAYLAGLLHDFGHLVIGHIQPKVFAELNLAVAANAHLSVQKIEECVLGLTHQSIGSALLRHWKLPDEAICAVAHHHNAGFRGEFDAYPHLVLIAEHFARAAGLGGDAESGEISEPSLAIVGLDLIKAEAAAVPVLSACAELDILANVLGNAA